jgi:hypothetical protein
MGDRERNSTLLLQLFYSVGKNRELVLNSHKPETNAALTLMIRMLAGIDETCQRYEGIYREPQHHCSRRVAEHKAEEVAGAHEIGVGADVAYWIQEGSRMVPMFKLDRYFEVPSQELIAAEYRRMRENLVYPHTPDGKVRMAWHISTSFVNGTKHTFDEWILLRSRPVPRELYIQHFQDSVRNGLFLGSNARISMIEMMSVHDGLEAIGFVPGVVMSNLHKHSNDLKRYMMTPNDAILDLATRGIITKVPHALMYGYDL